MKEMQISSTIGHSNLSDQSFLTTWDKRMMEYAWHVASWSKDPVTQVGCVLVKGKNDILSQGFNGFPKGVYDYPVRYANKDMKRCMVVHAERNAIILAKTDLTGATAYVTRKPCCVCTGMLIQAGVRKIVTHEPDNDLKLKHKFDYECADQMIYETHTKLVYVTGDVKEKTNGDDK